jgi:hypothetical protein
MTKKELIDLLLSEKCSMIPDDAQVVFRTNKRLRLCQPLRLDYISSDMEFEPDPYWERMHGFEPITTPPPGIKTAAIVIDALPTQWLKDKLNMTFNL